MTEPHNSEDLLDQLYELRDLLREHIVPAMFSSQLIAKERWEVSGDDQDDNFLFGGDSWRLMRNHIFRAIKKTPPNGIDGDIPFEQKANHGLSYGDLEIRWHRVGAVAPTSLELGTPKSSCRAARNVAKQYELFDESDEPPSAPEGPNGNTVVLAYTSKKDEGLTGVYLATIGTIDADKSLILNWQEKLTVWERDATIQAPTAIEFAPPVRGFDVADVMTFNEKQSAPPEFHLEEVITTSDTENQQDESESS